jgi:hypothetical protein
MSSQTKNVNKLFASLLKESFVLHLATSNLRGVPSNCALEFIQKDGNYYWRSDSTAQHSKNLTARKNCSICITKTNVDGTGEGIQAIGASTKISKRDERLLLSKLFAKKIQKYRPELVLNQEDLREYWKFTPKKTYYMNEKIFGYGRIVVTQNK